MVSRARGWESRQVPPTVAPPPRNGDAAQGHWSDDGPAFAASDRPAAQEPAPRADPALPTPAAIARTVAAGVLLSAGALLPAASVVLVLAMFRLAFSGDERLTFGGSASVLVTLGLALAYAGALAFPAWPWTARRPATLLLAAVVTVAWPLSGFPLPAALAAIVAVALALARDHRTPGGRRAAGPWTGVALVCAGIAATTAGLAVAEGHKLHRETSSAQHGAPGANTHESPARNTPADAAPGPSATEAPASPGARTPEPPAEHTRGADTPAAPSTGTSAAPVSPLADEAAAFVREYYAALDERRFDDAWALLSPAVRKEFGGFARWKRGYARTVSSRPRHITVRAVGEPTVVEHRLAARDKGCAATQVFSVTWRLERAADTWTVVGLRGSALPGPRCR